MIISNKKNNKGNLLIIFFFKIVILFCCFCLFKSEEAYSNNSKQLIFSSRVKDEKSALLVVKNDNVFIRKVVGKRFEYEVPENKCFRLLNDITVCVKNKKIESINGIFYNAGIEDKIKTSRFADEFFSESNVDCNLMKFDIINRLFVERGHISGFPTQLYLLGYYNVLRLFLYIDNSLKKTSNNLKAFVISDTNDVGCSLFYDYKIYKLTPDSDYNVHKKNTKNNKKKIKAKTEREYFKKSSIESYKTMLLNGYVYLEPVNRNVSSDIEKIVLSIRNDKVVYFNTIALDLKWLDIGFEDVFSKEAYQDGNDDNKIANRKSNIEKLQIRK